MAGYIGSKASVVSSGAERKKTFAITTTTTVLTGLSYTPTFVHLFHNGVRLVDGTDYTATNGTSITLTSAAESGDEVVVISYASFQVADAYTKAEADSAFVSDPNGAITVDGSGNVGIGTASPSGASGNALVVNGGVNQSRFALKNDYTGDGATNGFQIALGSDKSVYVEQREDSFMAFSTNGAERMRIDSFGRVTMPYQPVGTYTFGGLHTARYVTIHRNTGNHLSTHPSVTAGRTGDFVRFTAPVNGSYAFSISVVSISLSQTLLISMYGNFSPLNMTYNGQEIIDCRRSAALEEAVTFSGVIYMAAGDTFEPDIYRATNGYHDTSASIRVSIHLIG